MSQVVQEAYEAAAVVDLDTGGIRAADKGGILSAHPLKMMDVLSIICT